jgi:Flp pilus assembly protein TadB
VDALDHPVRRAVGGRALTAAVLSALCLGLAVLAGADRSGAASSRLRAALPEWGAAPAGRGAAPAGPAPDPWNAAGPRSAHVSPAATRWAGRGVVAVVAVLLLTGRGELGVPLGLAFAVHAVPARWRAARRAAADELRARDLPRAAELLATCLEAGAAPADAVQLVCDVVGDPVRSALLPLAAALRAGVDPSAVAKTTSPGPPGAGGAGRDDPLQRLGRAFGRALATGAPLADTVAALAADERERARWAAEAAARRAGVRAVGPLAVCFLPAFVLLGVVPVVAGVAGAVLGGLG